MKILGIPLHWPSTRSLAHTAAFVCFVTLVLVALSKAGIFKSQLIPMMVAGFTTGALISDFGVSVAGHGWRAWVVLLGVANGFWITYALISTLWP